MIEAVATGTRRGLDLTSDGSLNEMARVVVMTPPAGSLGARVGVIGSAGVTGRTAGVGDRGWIAMVISSDGISGIHRGDGGE